MKILTNPWFEGALLLVFLILAFALLKGCQNSKNQIALIAIKDSAIVNLQQRIADDSLTSRENEKDYKVSLEYANGIIALRENQRDATEVRLLATTTEYEDYRKKHQHIRPSIDTSATLVPNEFVIDAQDCFEKREEQRQIIKLYVQEVHDLDSAQAKKDSLNSKRIVQLEGERDGYKKNADSAINIAKTSLEILKPRGKVLLSLGALWVRVPSGIGGGFIYQDKKSRQFGLKVYGSNWGTLYQSELNFPLSFRRKR